MDHFSKLRTTSVQLTFAKKKRKQFYGKHTFPFLMMLLMVFWPLCVCVLRDLRRDLGPKKIFVD